MSTAHHRTPITVQAVPGQDDDLIDWLRHIPKGDRQKRLKALLKAGIQAEQNRQQALDSIDTIADDMINAVNASLLEVLDSVKHEVQIEAKATREFIGMAALAPTAKAEPTITAAPKLDPDEAARRKNAIKAKNQW